MNELSGIEVLILAGGQGTRLRSRVPDRQKVFAEVAGRPFLDYHLEALEAAGARAAVLCTGYKAEPLEAHYGEAFGTLPLIYSRESEPLGTAGAVRQALSKTRSDPLLVLNGDSFAKVNWAALLAFHRARDARGSMVLCRVADAAAFGTVAFDERRGEIVRFVEKNPHGGAACVNAGVYLFSRRLLEELPDRTPLSLEREVFPEWAAQRALYAYVQPNGKFIDIGTPDSYSSAQEVFKRGAL